MIVYHVEYHADAGFVQRLHHLLELADAAHRVVRVGGIRAFGHVVVQRVVAPVVLRHIELCLVYRGVIERRQQMHGVDAQRLQMGDGLRLCQGKKLALVAHARGGVDGEVAVVHLVYNMVGRRFHHRAHIALPPLGIGFPQVDHCTAPPVYTHSLGRDAGALAAETFTHVYVEGIKLPLQVAFNRRYPSIASQSGIAVIPHTYGFYRLSALSLVVNPQFHGLTLTDAIEPKGRFFGRVSHFCKIVLLLCLYCLTSCQRQ